MDLADIRKKSRTQGCALPVAKVRTDLLVATAAESIQGALSNPVLGICDGFDSEQYASEEEYALGLTSELGVDESEHSKWLSFYLGVEEYALDLEVVSELIKPRSLTELPQVPAYVLGIISLRGEVIPVVDLKQRLTLDFVEACDVEQQRIIVCEGNDQRIGLLVDRISQVVSFAVDEIETPQLVGDNPTDVFIAGIGRKHGRMQILLHPENVMRINDQFGN